MDEMTDTLGNFAPIIIAMAVVVACVLLLSALRRGWRAGRTGHWRRVVAMLNLGIFLNLIVLSLGNMAQENLADNEWLWLALFATGPLLIGYAFGSTLALALGDIRITRSRED